MSKFCFFEVFHFYIKTFGLTFGLVKRVISILTLIFLLVQSVSTTLIYVDYLSNQAAITKQFCINKSKPQNTCAGKCHLKKQLDAQTSDDSSFPANLLKEKLEYFSNLSDIFNCLSFPITADRVQHHTALIQSAYTAPAQALLQPPKI
jgi:hypothetical protein